MTLRVLLVEDDPTSREFFCLALKALPAEIVCTETRAGALRAKGAFSLFLIDANLPDGSGTELLQQLNASSTKTPALAHTADHTLALQRQLCEAGFAGVIHKPIQAEALRNVVREALGIPVNTQALTIPLQVHAEVQDWDDAAALKALGGNPTHLATLRSMFLDELVNQRDGLVIALRTGDIAGAHDQLHRLKASCGLVGAARLRLASTQLDQMLPDNAPLPAFEEACKRLLASR